MRAIWEAQSDNGTNRRIAMTTGAQRLRRMVAFALRSPRHRSNQPAFLGMRARKRSRLCRCLPQFTPSLLRLSKLKNGKGLVDIFKGAIDKEGRRASQPSFGTKVLSSVRRKSGHTQYQGSRFLSP